MQVWRPMQCCGWTGNHLTHPRVSEPDPNIYGSKPLLRWEVPRRGRQDAHPNRHNSAHFKVTLQPCRLATRNTNAEIRKMGVATGHMSDTSICQTVAEAATSRYKDSHRKLSCLNRSLSRKEATTKCPACPLGSAQPFVVVFSNARLSWTLIVISLRSELRGSFSSMALEPTLPVLMSFCAMSQLCIYSPRR